MSQSNPKMMKNYPVIVIGLPRTGTTTIARVLNDFFGVLMDGNPMPPPQHLHKFRWFEDRRLIEMNWLLQNNFIKLNAWTRRFKRFIRAMEKARPEWGFKDPRIIPVFSYALSFFKSPTIIRTWRPKKLVMNSYIEKLKWEPEYANKFYDTHEAMLTKQINRPHYRIEFGREISEEEIFEMLNGSLYLRHDT